MSLVIDASAALACVLRDERDILSDDLVSRLESEDLIAPSVWAPEVANGLLVSVRRGRLIDEEWRQSLAFFKRLNVVLYPLELSNAEHLIPLALRHQLTVYDAAYLNLALQRDAVLVTLDRALRRAAVAEGMTLFPPEPA